MVTLHVTLPDGEARTIAGDPEWSVMEAIRDAGISEMLALCNGCCSCATCHVYVDPAFAARLPAISEDEDELLSLSPHRTERSRLSCQLPCKPELAGMRLTMAPRS